MAWAFYVDRVLNVNSRKRAGVSIALIALLVAIGLLWQFSQKAVSSDRVRILPLGDSITQGGLGWPSYRRALWHKLDQAGYSVDFVGGQDDFYAQAPERAERDFDLDHQGHWAWETGEIAAKIDGWLNHWLFGYTPDVVIIHLGTNDFDRDQSIDSTLVEMETIIAALRRKNPAVSILIAEIIPMRSKDTEPFNAALRDWAPRQSTEASPLVLVDQYAGYDPVADNHDEYHPNAQGEEKMAQRWFAALQQVLRETEQVRNDG